MAHTRANWHLDIPIGDDGDPFQHIAEIGSPIDLTAPASVLHHQLADALKIEADLFNRNVTCAIKDDPQAACAACPLRGQDSRRELCEVGVRQEKLLTALAIGRHR